MSGFEANVALLRNSITIKPVALSNIIIISLEAQSPKAAAVVLNRLLDFYIRHHNEVFTKDEGADFYSDQAQRFQEKLQVAEEELREYRSQWNIVDLEAQTSDAALRWARDVA